MKILFKGGPHDGLVQDDIDSIGACLDLPDDLPKTEPTAGPDSRYRNTETKSTDGAVIFEHVYTATPSAEWLEQMEPDGEWGWKPREAI